MLRIRTDLLDLSGNPTLEQEKKPVPIYRRVDKVVKCFESIANHKNIDLVMTGQSYASGIGPDVFEIIPYVLIDNAVKYAPNYSNISVVVWETTKSIEIIVKSLGPNIESEEQESIFLKGVRSKAAKARDAAGSGIGLFLAKTLVGQFGGKIWVEVGTTDTSTPSGLCREITFCVSVPRHAD